MKVFKVSKILFFSDLNKAKNLDILIKAVLRRKIMVKGYSTLCSTRKSDFKSFLPGDIKLAPWWVTGIIDSEGNISIMVQKPSNGVLRPKISLAIKVTQKEHSASQGILLDLLKYFGCGNIIIDSRKENAYKFS